MKKTVVGVIGCGNISGIYLKNMTTVFSDVLYVKGLSDLIIERSQSRAEEFGIPVVYKNNDELYNDPEIDIVVNLTTPDAHAEVTLGALNAGKHAHCEKPMAITLEDGQKILKLAKEKNLYVGNAPDTFMGSGIQTCKKLIDDGWIGKPTGATAFMTCIGHESWHPDPDFYYQVGGGPMFDMGPYYLTALVSLLGPVKRVCGSTTKAFEKRMITSEPHNGDIINVGVPTHVAGIMDFECGVNASILTSFDVWGSQLPCIEIYGTEGVISVPDPNGFKGPVKVKRFRQETVEFPLVNTTYSENSRGLGVADMALAIQAGRINRCNGTMAYHILELMHSFHIASDTGKYYEMKSTCEKPAAMPLKMMTGHIDDIEFEK